MHAVRLVLHLPYRFHTLTFLHEPCRLHATSSALQQNQMWAHKLPGGLNEQVEDNSVDSDFLLLPNSIHIILWCGRNTLIWPEIVDITVIITAFSQTMIGHALGLLLAVSWCLACLVCAGAVQYCVCIWKSRAAWQRAAAVGLQCGCISAWPHGAHRQSSLQLQAPGNIQNISQVSTSDLDQYQFHYSRQI